MNITAVSPASVRRHSGSGDCILLDISTITSPLTLFPPHVFVWPTGNSHSRWYVLASVCLRYSSTFGTTGHVSPCTTISSLPDELLVEILDWYRLDDEYSWSHRRRWYKSLQVCRRWRYVVLEWASRLKLRFLCNVANPITTIPSHLSAITALPLIISFNLNSPMPSPDKEKLLLALQDRHHICNISIHRWDSGDLELHRSLNNVFPMLETLSLTNGRGYQNLELPNNFVAPRLRALHLLYFTIPKGHLSPTNATNLISLRLEGIPRHDGFLPEYLVECIASMPRLENIWISFNIGAPGPDTVMEFPQTQITRVVLPRLSRFDYAGVIPYLENLLTRISTPSLQDFRSCTLSKNPFTARHLSTFLGTIQNLDLRTAMLSFSSCQLAITYYPDQPSVSPPNLVFGIIGVYDLNTAASVVQICSAVASALQVPVVEYLALEWHHHRLQVSDFPVEPTFWHTFLRSFGGVKTLRADEAFAPMLSDVLHPNNEAAITELLPVLSELVVVSLEELHQQPFSSFIRARRLAGHPIDLRVILDHPSSLPPPRFSWDFDTF